MKSIRIFQKQLRGGCTHSLEARLIDKGRRWLLVNRRGHNQS